MNSLLFFEQILLILGIVLFLVLCAALIFSIVKNRELKVFIALFMLPIVMIGYPSITAIKIGEWEIALNQLKQQVIENPQDSVAMADLEAITIKLESRAKVNPNLSNSLIEANILLEKPDKALDLVNQALVQEKEQGTTAVSPVNDHDTIDTLIVGGKIDNRIEVLKNYKKVAELQGDLKSGKISTIDTATINSRLKNIDTQALKVPLFYNKKTLRNNVNN